MGGTISPSWHGLVLKWGVICTYHVQVRPPLFSRIQEGRHIALKKDQVELQFSTNLKKWHGEGWRPWRRIAIYIRDHSRSFCDAYNRGVLELLNKNSCANLCSMWIYRVPSKGLQERLRWWNYSFEQHMNYWPTWYTSLNLRSLIFLIHASNRCIDKPKHFERSKYLNIF